MLNDSYLSKDTEGRNYVWKGCAIRAGRITKRKRNQIDKTGTDLMEELRDIMGLMYISDIPRCRNWKKIAEAVEKLPAREYSSDQWKDLMLYLLKT